MSDQHAQLAPRVGGRRVGRHHRDVGIDVPRVKDLLTRIAVPDLLAWRFLAASLVLAVLNPVALVRAGWRTLALGGAIGMLYFGAQYLHFVGLQYVAPTVSAFLLSMYVVITPFIAGAMARRWPTRRTLVASLLAAMGWQPCRSRIRGRVGRVALAHGGRRLRRAHHGAESVVEA